MHVCTVFIWRCEHTFFFEVFMLDIYIFIHSFMFGVCRHVMPCKALLISSLAKTSCETDLAEPKTAIFVKLFSNSTSLLLLSLPLPLSLSLSLSHSPPPFLPPLIPSPNPNYSFVLSLSLVFIRSCLYIITKKSCFVSCLLTFPSFLCNPQGDT